MNVRERQRSSLTLERGESNSLGISTGTSPTLRSVNLSYSPNSPSLHLRRSSVDSNGGSSQQRRRSSGFPTHHFAGFLGDNSLPLRSNTLSTAALKGTRSWHWKVLFTFVLLLCIGGLGGLFAPGSALRQVVRLSTSIAPLTSTAPVAPLASLEERLRRLETLPILSQVDIEPYNREGCPDGQFRREAQAHEFDWMLMDDAFVRSARQGMVDHLRKLERDGAEVVWDPTRHVGGAKRGVVLAGGNAGTVPRLLNMVNWIRGHLESSMPIEVFHYADELQDIVEQESLRAIGVTLRQIEEKHGHDHRSYGIKGKALLQSSFEKFLYLDSDAVPLQPLDSYFDSYEMRTQGSAFYNDLSKDNAKNPIFRVVGKPCSGEHWTAETGQILFDKSANGGLNLAVLHLTDYQLTKPDHFAKLGWGDKDLFRYGFYALNLKYSQAPRVYAPLGGYRESHGLDIQNFCGHSLLHWALTPVGQENNQTYHPLPGFIHTNQLKHFTDPKADKLFTTYQRAVKDRTTDEAMVRAQYKHDWSSLCLTIELLGPDGRSSEGRSEWDGQAVVTESFEAFLNETEAGQRTWVALQSLAGKMVQLPKAEVN